MQSAAQVFQVYALALHCLLCCISVSANCSDTVQRLAVIFDLKHDLAYCPA